MGNIKGRRASGRLAQEGRQRCKKERGKRREESLSIGEESKFKGTRDPKAVERHAEKQERTKERKRSERDCVTVEGNREV